MVECRDRIETMRQRHQDRVDKYTLPCMEALRQKHRGAAQSRMSSMAGIVQSSPCSTLRRLSDLLLVAFEVLVEPIPIL